MENKAVCIIKSQRRPTGHREAGSFEPDNGFIWDFIESYGEYKQINVSSKLSKPECEVCIGGEPCLRVLDCCERSSNGYILSRIGMWKQNK